MATATPAKPKTRKPDNKIHRYILPALYEAPGTPAKQIVDPRTGKAVEALYFYEAERQGLIEKRGDDVKTGQRGRPARRWYLTKATRDRLRKQAKRTAK